MKKGIIIGIAVGIVSTVFTYHAYTVYQLQKAVSAQGAAISQIVDFLNKSVAQKAPVATPTPAAPEK